MTHNFAWICTDGGCGGVIFTLFILLPLLGIIAVATVIYVLMRVTKQKKPTGKTSVKNESKSFLKIFLIILGVVIAGVVLLGVIPTVLEDNSWELKQEDCARIAGYSSPAEDNSFQATAESQATYRRCLDT